ncbi:Hypothetical protein A7A1_3584 [Bacillus subtilis subsp. subtilis str. BSP1]|nr:Hypothetical protein A7A1_3584 [Bacillus subtilis subsp. subtilis str. BSP1]
MHTQRRPLWWFAHPHKHSPELRRARVLLPERFTPQFAPSAPVSRGFRSGLSPCCHSLIFSCCYGHTIAISYIKYILISYHHHYMLGNSNLGRFFLYYSS